MRKVDCHMCIYSEMAAVLQFSQSLPQTMLGCCLLARTSGGLSARVTIGGLSMSWASRRMASGFQRDSQADDIFPFDLKS